MYYYTSKILAPFLNLTNLLFFILIIFILINFKKSFKYKKIIGFVLFLLIIVSFFPIGKWGLKYLEKDYFAQEKILNIDNIIVLAGSEDLISTNITKKLHLSESSERLIASVELADKYPSSIIYHLGGNPYLKKNNIDEIEVAKLFYNNIGFDLDRVKFVSNSRNTIENLNSIKNDSIFEKSNLIITSAFHMKRVTLIAKKFNINFIPYAVDFRSINYSSLINYYQMFNISNNWSSFNIFFKEIIGIFAFKIMY